MTGLGGRTKGILTLSAIVGLTAAACEKSTAPTPPPVATNTITITSAGVTPKNITVPLGSQVTFVNNDSRTHDMQSDPHPEHDDCPELQTVGALKAGESRQSANLNTARTCTYHDNQNEGNNSLRGSIVIE